jgi:hypothetical protein
MAATNQLQKIAALVDRLQPIGNKQRGMPIQAEEWNALVEVLSGILEIDRAQEENAQASLEQKFAPLVHEHLGQVSVTWLDAVLQTTISSGGGDVPTRLVLTDMAQKLAGLGTQVAQLTTTTEDQRRLLDGFSVNDVDRAKALRDFDTRFASVANLNTSVTGLASQIDGLKTSLNTVLDLGKSLSDPSGAPIDVGKIRQELTDLEGLRDNLKGIDGTLVRVRDLQLQLKDVSDVVGVGGSGGLDGRLTQLSNDLEGRLNTRIDAKAADLQTQLRTENSTAIDKVRTDLTASVAQARADLDASATAKVQAAEGRINAATTTSIAAALQSFRTETTGTVNALLDQRLAGLPDQINTAVGASTNQLAAGLRTEFTATIANQVQAQAADLNTKLDARLGDVQNQMNTFRQEVQSTIKSTVADASTTITANVNNTVTAQVAQARQGIEAELDGRVKTAIDASNATLDARIGANLDQRLSTLDTRIGSAVTQALRNLPGQITTEVKSQLTAANLAGQIQDSTTRLTQQFRSELAQSIADQQARTSAALNDAVKTLRGEIGAAQKTATDAAVERAGTLVSALRDETNKTIDQRLGTRAGGISIGATPTVPTRNP